MNRIKIVSFYVARLFDFIIIALPVYIIFQWIFVDAAYLIPYEALPIDTVVGIIHWDKIQWTSLSRFIACCSQLIGFTPFLGILYYLSQICHRYELGAIFTITNAQCYYQIGKLLFFDALLAQPISGGLWVGAITFSNPVGQRCIHITLGTPNVMALFMGLLVVFISWVMIEGSKIQDEQQLII